MGTEMPVEDIASSHFGCTTVLMKSHKSFTVSELVITMTILNSGCHSVCCFVLIPTLSDADAIQPLGSHPHSQ